jgi:hypothetical protein
LGRALGRASGPASGWGSGWGSGPGWGSGRAPAWAWARAWARALEPEPEPWRAAAAEGQAREAGPGRRARTDGARELEATLPWAVPAMCSRVLGPWSWPDQRARTGRERDPGCCCSDGSRQAPGVTVRLRPAATPTGRGVHRSQRRRGTPRRPVQRSRRRSPRQRPHGGVNAAPGCPPAQEEASARAPRRGRAGRPPPAGSTGNGRPGDRRARVASALPVAPRRPGAWISGPGRPGRPGPPGGARRPGRAPARPPGSSSSGSPRG